MSEGSDVSTDGGYTRPDTTLLGDEHVRRYRETGGEVGYVWNGAPILLLTCTGRRSKETRTVPLIFGRHGDDYLVVASKGGAPQHPGWYHNLRADPAVTVQVRAEVFDATARTAAADEKPELWSIMTAVWPNYDSYQTRTDRVIPLVVLTPT
jgi:deazaflavin-dependent oxidoreductase (nitroreductase family)